MTPCIALTIAACDDATPMLGPDGGRRVHVRLIADSVFVGRTMQVVAVATGDSATVAWPQFTWSSGDSTVARVDSNGVVLGLLPGEAVITATLNNASDSRTVRVALQRADGGLAFAAVARGPHEHCALSVTGVAACRTIVAGDSVPRYVPLAGSDQVAFRTFAVSSARRCGTTVDGALFCWGANTRGEFLTGRTDAAPATLEPVAAGGTRRFIDFSTSPTGSCGIGLTDSVVYCAGANSQFQLGHAPSSALDSIVTPVTGWFRARSVSLSAMSPFTCAIGIDGRAYCWGVRPDVGTLGATPSATPNGAFSSVSSGHAHVCALSLMKEVWCWGSNAFGQLGTGPPGGPRSSPAPVSSTERFVDVAAGNTNTCAVSTTGDIFCWGTSLPGALATHFGDARYAPVRLTRGVRFTSVSVGSADVCGVTEDGRLFCI